MEKPEANVIVTFEHPFRDYIAWILSGKEKTLEREDLRVTICPCSSCRPPSMLERALNFITLNTYSRPRSNLICANASRFFNEFGQDIPVWALIEL